MKRLLRKCRALGEDPFLALLNLRNTPSETCTTSPAQQLFGRRTKSLLPTPEVKLAPDHPSSVHRRQAPRASHLMKDHRDLKALQIGDNVRMLPIRTRQREWKEGTVNKTLPYRLYEVTDHNGHQYR